MKTVWMYSRTKNCRRNTFWNLKLLTLLKFAIFLSVTLSVKCLHMFCMVCIFQSITRIFFWVKKYKNWRMDSWISLFSPIYSLEIFIILCYSRKYYVTEIIFESYEILFRMANTLYVVKGYIQDCIIWYKLM